MRRKATAALTGLVAATAAVVLTTAGTSQAAGTKSYAYGLDIVAQGQSQVRQPYVESTDGSDQTAGGSELPDNPLFSGSIALLRAGNDTASVELLDLSIGGGVVEQLPPELAQGLQQLAPVCDGLGQAPPPELPEIPGGLPVPIDTLPDLQEVCQSFVNGEFTDILGIEAVNIECNGDTGTVDVLGLNVLSLPVEVPPLEPNTAILPENPGLNIVANRQTQNPDGSFTVDGLVVDLGGQAELVLGSATCGEPLPTEPVEEDPEAPPLAPAPEPVRGNLPVTG
jgi:hypothetical protein